MSRVSRGVPRVSRDSLGMRCEGVPSLFRGTPYLPPSVPAWIFHRTPDTLACPDCHREVVVLVPVECVRCRFFLSVFSTASRWDPGEFLWHGTRSEGR